MPIDVPIAWSSPPSKLNLAGDEIHVWKAALVWSPLFADLLSSDEQVRSKRFLLEKHRTRFAAGRAILRMILGSYLGVPSREIRVQYQPNGKPEIHSFTGPARLRFNLTHSDDLALFALTLDQEIGIDVEQVQPCPAGGTYQQSRGVSFHGRNKTGFSPSRRRNGMKPSSGFGRSKKSI
jgi:4'-phosphopantetheinyl transferase